MLNADSPGVLRFLAAWHENGRPRFERDYPNLDYDSDAYRKVAKLRSTKGALAIFSSTGPPRRWSIKGYGKPNRKIGSLDALADAYKHADRQLPNPGYVGSDTFLAKLTREETSRCPTS